MKHFVNFKDADHGTVIAVNPDHIVKMFEDGDCAVVFLADGKSFGTRLSLIEAVKTVEESYE